VFPDASLIVRLDAISAGPLKEMLHKTLTGFPPVTLEMTENVGSDAEIKYIHSGYIIIRSRKHANELALAVFIRLQIGMHVGL